MRGEFITLLHELTQGTSFYDATCTRILGSDNWEICFTYRPAPDFDQELSWCTTTDDPEPPPIPPPNPPPPGWPADYQDPLAQLFALDGTISCWDGFPYTGMVWDPDLGEWGGWGMWFDGFTLPDIFFAVFPVSWTSGFVTWRTEWEVAGGGSGFKEQTQVAGIGPSFDFGLGGVADCPAARLFLVISFP